MFVFCFYWTKPVTQSFSKDKTDKCICCVFKFYRAEINLCIKYKLWNLHHSILDLCLHKDKIQLQHLTGVYNHIREGGTRSDLWILSAIVVPFLNYRLFDPGRKLRVWVRSWAFQCLLYLYCNFECKDLTPSRHETADGPAWLIFMTSNTH